MEKLVGLSCNCCLARRATEFGEGGWTAACCRMRREEGPGMEHQLPRQRGMMMTAAAGTDVVPDEDKDGMNCLKLYQIRHFSQSAC